jgi:hypothetical protein
VRGTTTTTPPLACLTAWSPTAIGLVQGGQHVGGGRSVAPTRAAPVPEGGGDPPEAADEKAAFGHRPPVEDRGNPLDLE